MLEIADKNFKKAHINVLKNTKFKKDLRQNLNYKNNQVEIQEIKCKVFKIKKYWIVMATD